MRTHLSYAHSTINNTDINGYFYAGVSKKRLDYFGKYIESTPILLPINISYKISQNSFTMQYIALLALSQEAKYVLACLYIQYLKPVRNARLLINWL